MKEGVGNFGTMVPLAIHVLFRLDGVHTLNELINQVCAEALLDKNVLTGKQHWKPHGISSDWGCCPGKIRIPWDDKSPTAGDIAEKQSKHKAL
jgi:hypothetical protein